jgi:hypothetical protein
MAVGVASSHDSPGFLRKFRKMLLKSVSHRPVELLIGKHPVEIQSPADAAGEKMFLESDSLDVGLGAECIA